jgi:hypothetical protein
MSEDQTTQAAVDEPKVPAAPGTEATSARTDDDLDTLLAEFDGSKTSSPEPAKPEPRVEAADDVKDASAEVLRARDEIRQDRFKRDMNDTIEKVRGDLPSDFYDNTFMQAWIDAKASSDPRLAAAWVQRNENPQKFKQVVGALGKEFAKKYGKLPDRQATEDREAVTAAVRGSSTRAPEGKAPDYAAMTPGDFQAEKDRMFGR